MGLKKVNLFSTFEPLVQIKSDQNGIENSMKSAGTLPITKIKSDQNGIENIYVLGV